jgi:hypothetical protein
MNYANFTFSFFHSELTLSWLKSQLNRKQFVSSRKALIMHEIQRTSRKTKIFVGYAPMPIAGTVYIVDTVYTICMSTIGDEYAIREMAKLTNFSTYFSYIQRTKYRYTNVWRKVRDLNELHYGRILGDERTERLW